MHQSTIGPFISTQSPVDNVYDPRHFTFSVRGTDATGLIRATSSRSPPDHQNIDGRGWSNPGAQRPLRHDYGLGGPQSSRPSPSFDDPAFSSNPYYHPDHHIASLGGGRFDILDDEPPPYEVLVSPDNSGIRRFQNDVFTSKVNFESDPSGDDMRDSAQILDHSASELSFASASHYSSMPQNEEEGQPDRQSELLAYLQEEEDRDAYEQQHERDIPATLRPHMGLPVTSQVATNSQTHGRLNLDNGLLHNPIVASGSTNRTASEPVVPTCIERPALPQRGNTTSPRRTTKPTDLDRIDELDESTPLGLPIHHRGPYEVQGKVATPPTRRVPIQREEEFLSDQHVIVAGTSSATPLSPVPYKLDLKPGEFITRLPPTRSWTGPPAPRPPLATMNHAPSATTRPDYRNSQCIIPEEVRTHLSYLAEEQFEWSPEQLYENQSVFPIPPVRGNVIRYPYDTASPNGSNMSSSVNSSRSDLKSFTNVSNSFRDDYTSADEHRHPSRRVTFQHHIQDGSLPPTPPTLQVSSQASYNSSIASSIYSHSSSSRSRLEGPPSSVDRLRPKKIVMPAPLQQQKQTFVGSVLGTSNYNGSKTVPIVQASAANIPMHEPKKGSNLLKKRASTGSSSHQNHQQPTAESAPLPKDGSNSFGGSYEGAPGLGPERKESKTRRKLSKRKTFL